MERRQLGLGVEEVRAEGEKPRLSGYAAVFYAGSPETEYRLWEGAVERFSPGAFTFADDVLAVFNHNPERILGRVSSGTLQVRMDAKGLRYEIDPGDTSTARDVREYVRRGDLSGSSIGFEVLPGGEEWQKEGSLDVRVISRARVFELGPVVEPAYAGTSAEARAVGSVEAARESLDRSPERRRERVEEEYRSRLGKPGMRARLEKRVAELRRGHVVSRALERIQERRCAGQHIGLWDCEPNWLRGALELWKADRWPAVAISDGPPEEDSSPPDILEGVRIAGGVAELELRGQITKRASSLGGASSLRLRRQLRELASREDVRGIWLRIDSPGGTAAGTDDLAEEVRRARRRGKRVVAYVEDLCASAAYWAASQAERIIAGPTGEIGSIGTFCVVFDTSERFAKEGVQAHLIATGEHKGAGSPGVPITSSQLDTLRRQVEDHFAHFAGAVARGRDVEAKLVRERWGTGETWIAARAKELGLIDEVSREDEALERFRQSFSKES